MIKVYFLDFLDRSRYNSHDPGHKKIDVQNFSQIIICRQDSI